MSAQQLVCSDPQAVTLVSPWKTPYDYLFNKQSVFTSRKYKTVNSPLPFTLSFATLAKLNNTTSWCSGVEMAEMLFLCCWAHGHPIVDERGDFQLPITSDSCEVKQSGQNPPAQQTLCRWPLETSADLAEPQTPGRGALAMALTLDQNYPGSSCESWTSDLKFIQSPHINNFHSSLHVFNDLCV